MPDELLPPWAQLATVSGLITLVVLSLVRGWLVPRSTVDRLMEYSEKRLADRDQLIEALREQNSLLDERNDLLAAQVRQLVDMGHTSLQTITRSAGGIPDQRNGGSAPSPLEGTTKVSRSTKSRRRSR